MELDQFKDVNLVIDKANDIFIPRQFVSQGDYKGRTLTVQITNNGSIGEVPGLTLNLTWHNEASGLTDLTAFTVLDEANSIFRIEYPENMMTPGKVYASIQIIQNGKVTNLKQFELIVQELAGQPVGITEKAEFSALVAVLADANKFRTDIDKKADKNYINDYLSKVTVVPETFANLAAIQSKYPNGANGVMVAADNGHKYIWANNVWTDAGVYQSVGIADGTISLPMLDNQLKSNFISVSEYTPQLSGVGGVNIADGKVIDFGTQDYWTHAQYNVAGNSRLYVSFGKSSNTAVTGHIFATDDDNTILASFVPGSGETENIDNYEIVTPAGTTKLFVQSFFMDNLSVGTGTYQSLSETIEKSNFLYISNCTPQLSGVGVVNIADGKVIDFGTQDYWTHAQYNVAGNSRLYVSFGKSSNTAVTGHIFATDDDNTILASFVPGSGETENIDNYEIVTPAGTTKLFVQSFFMDNLSVGMGTYQSLSETIEKSNTDLKQEIDNELRIYKEINNSNVYNFISRQGTLGGYPENSNKAVLNVKQNGFNSVRVSVAFTADNVPVLIHDASINRVARNSDGSAISSNINISDITLEQANTYDWGIAAGSDFEGLKIPLLSDFLKICSFKSIFPTLEFKPSTATDEQLGSIINMVNQYGLTDKTYFTSTVDAILLSVNKINPSINIGFIADLNSSVWVDRALQFKTSVNKVRIDMFDTDTPSTDVINYASSKGVGIKVGSAYSLADIVKFASMGVTDIEVAYVAFPATALNEYYDNL